MILLVMKDFVNRQVRRGSGEALQFPVSSSFLDQIVVDDEIAIIDVLDMENREEFRAPAMKEQYIKTGDGFLLVYAIDSLESLDEVRTVYQEISAVKAGCGFPVVLLGSKCDLEEKRVVSIDGQSYLSSTQST